MNNKRSTTEELKERIDMLGVDEKTLTEILKISNELLIEIIQENTQSMPNAQIEEKSEDSNVSKIVREASPSNTLRRLSMTPPDILDDLAMIPPTTRHWDLVRAVLKSIKKELKIN